MKRAEVLAELRSLLADTAQPYGWSDARLMRFLALGQDQFCRDTGWFNDLQAGAVLTREGEASYELPARSIQVLEVWYSGAQLFEKKLTPTPSVGPPTYWRADWKAGYLTISPTPDAAYSLDVRVIRKALVPFDQKTATGTFNAELEIPEEFHFAPIEFAAHKAFGDHDRELQDPVKAADHLANYKDIMLEGKRALRRLTGTFASFAPNPLYVV